VTRKGGKETPAALSLGRLIKRTRQMRFCRKTGGGARDISQKKGPVCEAFISFIRDVRLSSMSPLMPST